jgi:KinB signaling pathway activation protein
MIEENRGGPAVRLTQFLVLVCSTVCVGAAAGLLLTLTGWFLHLSWLQGLISGAFFSTTCLMGFWAYLMLNFVASTALPKRVWRWAQWLLIAVVLYDLLVLRYQADAARRPGEAPHYAVYLIQGLWPLAAAAVTGWIKRRQSGSGSFLPAMFYVYVFTFLDGLLVIWPNQGAVVNQASAVLTVCNMYIVLVYGKLLEISRRRTAADRANATLPAPGAGQRQGT